MELVVWDVLFETDKWSLCLGGGVAINARNWQEIIKPSALERKTGDLSGRRSSFVAEPLERGFGLTLGNALRRVLLSSLQGSAVTAIMIEGVEHEFSSLAGVREDVTDIILNVKQMALKIHGTGRQELRLSISGPAEVRAGDIGALGDVEVMNPDLVLCHLDEGSTLRMRLFVDTGKGYVPAFLNRPADAPIGFIPVDALYSPVRQVSYKVESTRVGRDLDYDKLTIMVETDGTVTPEDALAYAARILQDQLALFVHFDDSTDDLAMRARPVPDVASDVAEAANLNRFLLIRIDDLELSVRSANCLKNEEIVYVGDLVQKTEAELLRLPNFGRKSLNEIKSVLAGMGLRLDTQTPGYPTENIEEMARRLEGELFGAASAPLLSGNAPPRGVVGRPRASVDRGAGPDSAKGGAPEERDSSIGFFFGTCRQLDEIPVGSLSPLVRFGSERANALTLGMAQVHVPPDRLFGTSGRPWKWPFQLPVLSLSFLDGKEDPRRHFVLQKTEILDPLAWEDLVRRGGSTDAFVFVHGFWTSFEDALYRAAQIFFDLQYGGTPVLFSWASRGQASGYGYDLESAAHGAEHFLQLLTHLRQSGISRVHILAHSMGNYLVLNALYDLIGANRDHSIGELIMAAPDVDRDLYLQRMARLRGRIPGLTLYASAKDRALSLSKSLRKDVPRAGDVPKTGPILADGVDTIDVTAIGEEMFGSGHGTYSSARSVLNDIGLLIGTGTRPPNKRLVELRGMPAGAIPSQWWQFAR